MRNFLPYLNGFIKIRIHGGQTERFLNLCMSRGIILWDLSGASDGSYSCFLSTRHFFLLAPARRKTKVQIHILEKHGLPFFFANSKNKKAFFAGILLSGILLFVLSGRIWNIHIEGNRINTTPEILKFLEKQGISHGIPKKQVNCSSVASQIRERYPETAWVSAKIQGTRLIITVKEGNYQTIRSEGKPVPCSICAEGEGKIVKMITRSGVPLKKIGDTCKKGDILVLGRLELKNDAQEVFRYEYVHADADIYIKRKLPYYAELPMEYEKEIFFEKEKKGGFIKAGSLYLEWGAKPQKGWKRMTEEHPLRFTENFELPLSVGSVTLRQYKKKSVLRKEDEAKAEAFRILQKYEKKLMEKGVQIFANNVKIEVDHKNCISSGTLEIIEKIGKEVPVERMELSKERTTENG